MQVCIYKFTHIHRVLTMIKQRHGSHEMAMTHVNVETRVAFL